jgi:hypothetical protein
MPRAAGSTNSWLERHRRTLLCRIPTILTRGACLVGSHKRQDWLKCPRWSIEESVPLSHLVRGNLTGPQRSIDMANEQCRCKEMWGWVASPRRGCVP